MSDAIAVRQLGKKFRLYRNRNSTLKTAVLRGGRADYEDLWAVRGVTLDVPVGTALGLIGSNGSGKSTLLRCLARILRPDEGHTVVQGRVAALLELGSGFHPELTGRQNVFLNGTILGLKRNEIARRLDDLVSFAGLERAIDQPVKNYSSGMYARLGFAIATSVDPEVLLVDEVLAVGDVAFQRRCMDRIRELRSEGRTIVVVSHDSDAVRDLCDRAAWLQHGVLQQEGPVQPVLDAYLVSMSDSSGAAAGNRWGSGEVLIDEVSLLAENGRPVSTVQSGAPVTIRVAWSAKQPVDELVIGLGLWSADGTHLWGANTGDAGTRLNVGARRGVVTMSVPQLSLQAGHFRLDATAHDDSGIQSYDYRSDIVRFSVVPASRAVRESGGYVSLSPAWRTEELG